MKHTIISLSAILATVPLFAVMESATPESQGVPSEAILKFIDACEKTFDAGELGAMHGFVIVRHGKTIAEGSWKPFDTLNETHFLYSHSKSFTSSAIGLLVDQGKLDLDERVVDIFSNDVPAKVSENLAQLRVRDLLTMNAGKKDHLLRSGGDWVKIFLSQDFFRKPGTFFKYDSDATYMLAVIVEKKSGMKMMDYLQKNMFDKIGIKKAWTTYSPQGIPCGGWGMNMTTRELARFGQLYLNRGWWDGVSVLSSDWVSLATTRQTWSGWQNVGVKALGEGSDWEQGYGFQFWRCHHGAYRADGAGGQYTVVIPGKDMVVSAHANLGDFQKELNLIWDNLLPALKDVPLPENPVAQKELADRLAKLVIRPRATDCKDSVDFLKTFTFKDNPCGLKSVAFERITPKAKKANGATITCDRPTILCRLVTRAGEQKFVAGDGEWVKGSKIRIDTENYEGLGMMIGEHPVAASYGIVSKDGAPRFRLRAYLTGATSHFDFEIDAKGKLTGEYNAMNGCRLESK